MDPLLHLICIFFKLKINFCVYVCIFLPCCTFLTGQEWWGKSGLPRSVCRARLLVCIFFRLKINFCVNICIFLPCLLYKVHFSMAESVGAGQAYLVLSVVQYSLCVALESIGFLHFLKCFLNITVWNPKFKNFQHFCLLRKFIRGWKTKYMLFWLLIPVNKSLLKFLKYLLWRLHTFCFKCFMFSQPTTCKQYFAIYQKLNLESTKQTSKQYHEEFWCIKFYVDCF